MAIAIDIPMTCHAWLTHAMPKVREAMEHAWMKHGEPTTDPVRGALNLCEETGEVAKEALDATRPVPKPSALHSLSDPIQERTINIRERAKVDMITELYQVAGYAILLAVQLQGREKENRDQSPK